MFDRGRRPRTRLEGTIAGVGFETGDRFVVGLWSAGPLGGMADVMWAQPDGRRVLLAPSQDVARFVGGIYRFDQVRVVPFELKHRSSQAVKLEAGEVAVELFAGPPWRIFGLRPRVLRRSPAWVRIESSLFQPVLGRFLPGLDNVRGYGTTPAGVREWYAIDAYRPLLFARGRVDDRDLGRMRSLDPPTGFGFSEFPSTPALVDCAPVLEGAERFLPRTTGRDL